MLSAAEVTLNGYPRPVNPFPLVAEARRIFADWSTRKLSYAALCRSLSSPNSRAATNAGSTSRASFRSRTLGNLILMCLM